MIFTDEINSPAIYGIVNTKLFLNKDLIKNISDNELRYILLHELCHLKRKDILVLGLINLMKVIYWFNPIIIIALNTMQADCEVACDAKVLNFIDKKENLNYGKTIINILSYRNSKEKALGAIGMANNKNMIKERISMIGENNKFLESSYNKSYENASELIKENIEGYNEKILLGIHRGAGDSNNDGIAIILSENNPLYEENKGFADALKKEIKNMEIKNVGIYTYPEDIRFFNQDLSNRAIMIEVGSENSDKEQINTLIDGLTRALEKICKY